jgi:predicted nuclease of predicted toxin-antitoxin system
LKLKLDENVPAHLAGALQAFGHDVDSVQSEQLTGHRDADVWTAAQQDSRFLITQDLDFSDARKYVPGSHYGLLLVRLRRPGRAALFERIRQLFAAEPVETCPIR